MQWRVRLLLRKIQRLRKIYLCSAYPDQEWQVLLHGHGVRFQIGKRTQEMLPQLQDYLLLPHSWHHRHNHCNADKNRTRWFFNYEKLHQTNFYEPAGVILVSLWDKWWAEISDRVLFRCVFLLIILVLNSGNLETGPNFQRDWELHNRCAEKNS